MQLSMSCVGKMKRGPEQDLLERYADRIKRAAPPLGMSWGGIRELAESRALDVQRRKVEEANALLSPAEQSKAVIIALHEGGSDLTSPQWADLIGEFRDNGKSKCTFMIGGPDGHDASLLQRADSLIRLGKQTMPHQLVRIVVAEQLYRACMILSGHPYHRV